MEQRAKELLDQINEELKRPNPDWVKIEAWQDEIIAMGDAVLKALTGRGLK